MSAKNPLSTTAEWTFPLLERYDEEIAMVAHEFNLDTYPNQIEVISAEQMMDAYASTGMPLGYHHWSFGKKFVAIEKDYRRGHMGLAYELVINSNPCIVYLMEENSMSMQALVLAHAAYGHNSFFKNNYLFKLWSDADSIIDYLVYAKNFISECEAKHGVILVEETLDACHALMNYGVDRYKRPEKLSRHEQMLREKNRYEHEQMQINDLWRTIPQSKLIQEDVSLYNNPFPPEENLLYFIEKNAPSLERWQREIIHIIRKIAQYFYPQRQTKMLNEGWASFWHYTLLNALYEKGLLTDEFMLEFFQNHTNVIYQAPFTSPFYAGINPYTLGYSMLQDIRRICENPTDEDKKWFPEIANTDWGKSLDFAMRNFNDESFIAQYLSPNLIRELRLFSILDDDEKPELEISAIHDDAGYQYIRTLLSKQHNLACLEPNFQIVAANKDGDHRLSMQHLEYNRKPLSPSIEKVLFHLHFLWGFPVHLESRNAAGEVSKRYDYPKE